MTVGKKTVEIEASQAFETSMIKKRIVSKHDHLLDLTTIANIEKSIGRCKKQNLGQSPKDLNDLHDCLKKENWKQLLMMDAADSFVVEFIIKNKDTKAVIFIDKTLTE